MKNIAIITARSGSKGLKDKNIKFLNGKPLIAYSIEEAMKSNIFTEIMVSTDSEEYSKIATEIGAKVPFLRSKENSNDRSGSWDVVMEVLENYQKLGKKFDTVCLLQPTSPLRTSQDIINGYNLLNEKNADSIIGVCEMDHSPLWSNTLSDDLSMNDFINEEIDNMPRQDLPIYYRVNGALYIKKIIYNDIINLCEKKTFALVMDRKYSIDIDTELDFKVAELLLKSNI